ncbi:hypothetical protein FRB97_009600 [Tulasnella sp. 331]|nr:hypothetical protein FRB97_009600 [Tulasnella sp. 331]
MSTFTRRLLSGDIYKHNSRVLRSGYAQQYRRNYNARTDRCVAPVPNRALLSVTGSQAATFLNGITTVPIPDPTSALWNKHGGAAYSAFLSAQGRIMYDVLIYPYILPSDPSSSSSPPGYIIEYDPRAADTTTTTPPSKNGSTPTLMSMMKRYILRSKVRVRDVSDEWSLQAVWSSSNDGPVNFKPDDWRWGRSGAVEPVYHDATAHSSLPSLKSWIFDGVDISAQEALWAVDRRAPGMGVRVLVRTDSSSSSPTLPSSSSSDDYTLHRIKLGVPEGKDDMPPQDSFPMDANMDLMGGVDFRKGCYVGQELTVRTYHTGVVRKRTVPVQLIRDTLRATLNSGKTLDVTYRKNQLIQLAYLFKENEARFNAAFKADLGRPELEVGALEIHGTINECIEAWKNVDNWAKPDSVPFDLNFGVMRPKIYKQPKGVGLVIGPFNYPVLCSIGPLIGAIAAGCPCVVKLSELTPNVSGLFAELWPKYMDLSYAQIVNGGIPETTALLDLQWDHIVFTGSTTVGKVVAKAAAKFLTPTTLELGGQSPIFMDTNIDLKIATRRILWSKTFNSGQSCLAPNHLFVLRSQQDELVEAFKETYTEFYPDGAARSQSFSRIIARGHFDRLKDILDETDGDIVCGGGTDASQLFIAPTIVKNVKLDDALMKAEIFGPILPIIPVKDYQDAIDYTRAHDHPLAVYIFTDDAALKDKIITETTSGAVDVNDCVIHIAAPNLPFGGVGQSGSGSHTGKYSFDTFTHHRSSLHNPGWTEFLFSWRYPPYTDKKVKQSAYLAPSIPVPRPGLGVAQISQVSSGGWFGWTSLTSITALVFIATVMTTRRRSSCLGDLLGSVHARLDGLKVLTRLLARG